MALPPLDQAVRDAIESLADTYGPVSLRTLGDEMQRRFIEIADAIQRGEADEGLLVDANAIRRTVELGLAVAPLVEELRSSTRPGTVLAGMGSAYRIEAAHKDFLPSFGTVLTTGEGAVLGPPQALDGPFRAQQRRATTRELVAFALDREALLHQAAAKGRGGIE